MPKIAVIKTGGKPYKVEKGQIIKIEKLDLPIENKLKFDTLIIASNDGQDLKIGKPLLKQKVEGKVIEQGQEKKVPVVKYKNKTRYLHKS
jgi:large subunit ribosomal protein L21